MQQGVAFTLKFYRKKVFEKNSKKLLTKQNCRCRIILVVRTEQKNERRKTKNAIVVQLVAHDLAKVELAGSSPVYRSKRC